MEGLDENLDLLRGAERRLDLENETVLGVQGPNFSGRTTLLRQFTRLSADSPSSADSSPSASVSTGASGPDTRPEDNSVYIGPDPGSSITGARSLVRGEIALQMSLEYEEEWWNAAENLGLTNLLDRNPYTLSGGEKATLVVMTALALGPERLSIDCTLEQMNVSLKEDVLKILRGLPESASILVADNRLREANHACPVIETEPQRDTERPYRPITSEVDLPLRPEKTGRLAVEDIHFSYDDGADVLSGVSFELEPGQAYMLIGQTGAGKSTLAKLLVGVISPDQGGIFYNGEQHVPWKKPGQVVTYHLQNPDHQFFEETIEDEIKASPRKLGEKEEVAEARYRALQEALGFSGLEDRAEPLDAEAIPYSIRKRIAMAATLASARPWIILDEPTLGQDDCSVEALAALVEQLAEKGTGVVVISHSTYLQSRLQAEKLHLKDGTIHY